MSDQGNEKKSESHQIISTLREQIECSIIGQQELVTEALCVFLAKGHMLMTGAPGLAKTTLVRVLAQRLNLDHGRVQFTPDLLPSDIIGSEVLNMDPTSGQREFKFIPGPIFTNLLLADEINRASPRTQSAMLEAMQEKQVTVGGNHFEIKKPFMVFATQNPFESEGTFPLPEAQLDRFLIHSLVSYPDKDSESKILKAHNNQRLIGESGFKDNEQQQKLSAAQIDQVFKVVEGIQIQDDLIDLMTELVRLTRPGEDGSLPLINEKLWYGAGPRGGISLISMTKALAFMEQKDEVRWSHIKEMAKPVLRHRIRLSYAGVAEGLKEDDVIEHILNHLQEKYKNLAVS